MMKTLRTLFFEVVWPIFLVVVLVGLAWYLGLLRHDRTDSKIRELVELTRENTRLKFEAEKWERRRRFFRDFDNACRSEPFGGRAVLSLFGEPECIDRDVVIPITRAQP